MELGFGIAMIVFFILPPIVGLLFWRKARKNKDNPADEE